MGNITTRPRPAPEGFEWVLGNSGSTPQLVDRRKRLPKGQRLGDLPTNGVPDELFAQIMLRREDNQQFILRLPDWAAYDLAMLAMRDCEIKPYGYLLSLPHEELDWVIAKFLSDEVATA